MKKEREFLMRFIREAVNEPRVTEEYAEKMGRDCAVNGANTTNCNFRLFARSELTKAWERGKARK